MIKISIRQKAKWRQIYAAFYAIGTTFANTQKQSSVLDHIHHQGLIPPEYPPVVIDVMCLRRLHGSRALRQCIWGATYCAYLYSFLGQLEWDMSNE